MHKSNHDPLEHVLNHLPCGICQVILDDNLTISFANKMFFEFLGYADQTEYKDVVLNGTGFIHPKDYSELKACITSHVQNKDNRFAFDHRILDRNQKVKWVSTRAAFNPEMPDSLTCVIIDISEQRNILEQLRASEQKNRIATQHTSKVVNLYDINTKTLYQSPEAANKFGLPEIIRNVPDYIIATGLLAKDSISQYQEFYCSIKDGIPESETLVKICKRGGGYKWMKLMYTLLYTSDQTPSRAVISYEDVTLQHEKELVYQKWTQNFKEQEENSLGYYEYNLTKNRFVSVVGVDSSQLPPDVMDSYTRSTRYTLLHLIREEDKQYFYETFGRDFMLKRYSNGERSFQHETQILKNNGSLYWISITVQMLPDPYTNDLMLFVLLKNIDDEKRKSLSMQQLSEQDSMTGLYNRKSFIKHVSKKLKNAPDLKHALVMIDVDHFKQLNDTYGHQFGDAVIMDLTGVLRSSFRKGDYCGRLGGDEFIIFLPDIQTHQILTPKLKELCSLLQKVYPNGAKTSCSLGCSIYPDDGTDFSTLYHHADLALYKAKEQERGTYAFYKH